MGGSFHRFTLFATTLAGILTGALAPFACAKALQLHTGLELELRAIEATRANGSGEFIADLEPEFALSNEAFRVYGLGRIRASRDRYEPGQPAQSYRSDYNRRALFNDNVSAEIRELYLDVQWQRIDFRIGKQQVVWGQADGLKVLDVVNPSSFTEFILEPFEDSRIPLWMIKASTSLGPIDAQLLWILDATAHEFAPIDSPFALTAPRFRQPARSEVNFQRPGSSIDRSEFGLRLSATVGATDVAFVALSHLRDIPVYELNAVSTSRPFTARMKREELLGLSATRAFGDVVVRSEVGYTFDRSFTPGDLAAGNVQRSDTVGVVVGVDWFAPFEWFISTQYFVDYRRDALQIADSRQADRFATLALRKRFLKDRIEVSCIALYNARDGDYLWRPKISYEVNDTLLVALGADLFRGTSQGAFGQFQNASRAYFSLIWSVGG